MKTKIQIRKLYQNKRDKLSVSEIHKLSISISNGCLKIPIWHMENFHIFLSLSNKNEIETSSLLSVIMGKDKQVIVPRIIKSKLLEHVLLTDQTVLRTNSFRIPEPQNGIIISPKIIDVVFIPLYVFDLKGNRVGYGGGYYDRFLKECRKDTVKVGLSLFEPINLIQDISELDIKLDYAVTPDSIFSF
jgi:5-formyltetrahydrofolate cyclo-ligase